MTFEQAEFLGAIGPTGRASGLQRDVRVDSPYAGYPQFRQVVTATAGDLEARLWCALRSSMKVTAWCGK